MARNRVPDAENDWFDTEFGDAPEPRRAAPSPPPSARERARVQMMTLGVLLGATLIGGIALGAFSGPPEPASVTTRAPSGPERNAIAKAETHDGTVLLDEAVLLLALDELKEERAIESERGAANDEVATVDGGSSADSAASAEAPTTRDDPPTATAGAAKPTTGEAPAEPTKAAEPSVAKAAKAAEPTTAKPAEPTTAKAAAPATAKAAEPATAKAAEPATAKAAEPATAKATEPATPEATEPATAKAVDGGGDPQPGETAGDPKPDPVEAPADPSVAVKTNKHITDGRAHLKARKYKDAAEAFTDALALSPRSTKALVGRGQARYELGRIKQARKDFADALAINPKQGRALMLMGSIAQADGNRADARKYYERYMKHYPTGRFAGQVKQILDSGL